MSFQDIFKSSFLENVSSVSLLDMGLALVLAFGLGLFIFLIYKKTFAGVMYSSSFGVTLVALAMITTLVILAVTSNVVLSLGMVGALSIVRFRAAIKEPLDIAFLFWVIAVGIVLAAGMIPLAVIGSVVIGLVLLVFANRKSHLNPYIVVLRCQDYTSELQATEFLKEQVQRCVVKSKTAQQGSIELNVKVRMKDENTDFINILSEMNGVQSADSSSLVDASSVDISAMGTMNNGGGQRSWKRGMGQSQETVEGAGMSAATQGSAGQAPAIPQGQEGMGSPPELPSGEGPQEAPGQAAPDSASSATEESPSSEVESSSGEGDTSSGEESASAPAETGGATGQEPPTQPAEGAADAGPGAKPGFLHHGTVGAAGGFLSGAGNRAGGGGALPQEGVTILATEPARDGVPAVPRFVPSVPLRGM